MLSGSAAELETRDQYLEAAAMPERTLMPPEIGDRRIRVYGDTAVSTGRGTLRGSWGNKPISMSFRFTNVFALREGPWQAVASHVSAIE